MSHIKDDTDASVFQNSVFDWGSRWGSNNSLYGLDDDGDNDDVSGNYSINDVVATSSSRYDTTRGISRVRDNNDLVDDGNNSEDDNDDDEIIAPPRHNSSGIGYMGGEEGRSSSGRSSSRSRHRSSTDNRSNFEMSSWFSSIMKNRQIHCPSPWGRRWWVIDLSTLHVSRQQIILLLSVLGIIIVASVGIQYAVVGRPNNITGNDAVAPLSDEGVLLVEAGKQEGVEVGGVNEEESAAEEENEQGLFQLAKQVVTACAESMLDVDMSECQSLCHSSMCCFEKEEERYSCVNDEWKHCLAYAACANLLDDLPLEKGNAGEGGG